MAECEMEVEGGWEKIDDETAENVENMEEEWFCWGI